MADRWDLLLHSIFISREKFSNPSWQVSSGGANAFSLCLCQHVCMYKLTCLSARERSLNAGANKCCTPPLKVRCKEQGSKQFQPEKEKSGLSSEFNTHADVCRG